MIPEPLMDIMVLDKFDPTNESGSTYEFPDANVTYGCRKEINVDKFYDRTAGVLCGIKPCGIIAFYAEMFKSESPTHTAITIAHEYMKTKETLASKPQLYVYDRACDLGK